MKDVKLILKELDTLESQRIFWLKLSGFVAVVILVVIYKWDYFISSKLEWLIISAGLTLSVIWWYWTMVIIKKLIMYKRHETEVIDQMMDSIKSIKQEILDKQ
ncbi:MAG: hypothetical protein ACO3UU_15230 [Minisyncoccia bacterium]